jgi:osmotically-inducible protein OsmY
MKRGSTMNTNRNLVPAIFVAAVAFGVAGCAGWSGKSADSRTASTTAAEPRGPVQTAADAGITAKVKTALGNDELVKARNIDVDTLRGVVTLNGMVGSAAEKQRAIQVARGIEGVSSVKDNLRSGG